MKKHTPYFLLITLLLNCFGAFAQSKFTGAWNRNDHQTETDGLSINSVPVTLEITQAAGAITIKRTSVNGSGTSSSYMEVLKTDGSTSEIVTPSKLKRTATLQWPADHSAFTETYTARDDKGTIQQSGKQTFTLSTDGKTLKITAEQNYGDEHYTLEETYDKQTGGHHVILISIDGFRPEMYLDKSWPSPNLQRLMKKGTYANHLKSVFPAYTYPSHTAMITGALPARSGIWFNQPKGSKGEWNWFMDSIKVPTIFQKLKEVGLTTAAIGWPPSVEIKTHYIDHNLPEIWDVNHPSDRITGAKKYITPGLLEEIEKNATGKLDSTNFNDECYCWDENIGRAAAYVFKTYQPNFLAMHVAGVDDMSHEYGKNADSVKLALAADDRVIGQMVQAIKDAKLENNTTIIIVGDHGFSDINQVFRPNMLIKDLPASFTAAGGSAFLYLNDNSKADKNTIITQVKAKLDALPKDKRDLFRFVDRKELDQMGADSSAIFALAAKPGLVFSGAVAKAKVAYNGPGTQIQQNPLEGVFYPTTGGHHGYDPSEPQMYTGFIAYGAGIKSGGFIQELSEPDIAPLIAELLNIEFKTPDGKLVPGIIQE